MKTFVLADAFGTFVRFVLMPGQRFYTVDVAPLIEGVEFAGLVADKAFDSDIIIQDLNERQAKIVISQHIQRSTPFIIDAEIYKWRYLIENFFWKLKKSKRIVLRNNKTYAEFSGIIYLAAALINSK